MGLLKQTQAQRVIDSDTTARIVKQKNKIKWTFPTDQFVILFT
jgi:hypothetical protein